MARYKDEVVTEAMKPYLEEGETLKHWAYGVKQPNMVLIIFLYLLALIPGIIAVAVLTKEYVIGLTDRRFIVLLVSGGKAKVKEMTDYRLDQLPKVTTSTGALFTHIKIEDEAKPFVAKFHRAGMKENREHSMAIAQALNPGQAA